MGSSRAAILFAVIGALVGAVVQFARSPKEMDPEPGRTVTAHVRSTPPVVEGVDATQISEKEDQLLRRFRLGRKSLRHTEIADLFSFLGKSNPIKGLKLIEELGAQEKTEALQALIAAWVINDKDSAWSWIYKNESSNTGAMHIFAAAAQGMIAAGTEQSIRYAGKLAPINQRHFFRTYIDMVEEVSIPDLAKVFPQLNDYVQEHALPLLLARWSSADLKASLEWINHSGMSSKKLERAYAGVAAGISSVDPQYAVEWARALPKETSGDALKASVTNWIKQAGPTDFTSWLLSANILDKDELIGKSFNALVSTDPKSAMLIAEASSSPELARMYRAKGFAHIAEYERESAIEWLEGQREASDYPQLVNSIAIKDAEYKGIKAFDHLKLLTNQKDRDQLVMILALTLRRKSNTVSMSAIESLGTLSPRELETVRRHIHDPQYVPR